MVKEATGALVVVVLLYMMFGPQRPAPTTAPTDWADVVGMAASWGAVSCLGGLGIFAALYFMATAPGRRQRMALAAQEAEHAERQLRLEEIERMTVAATVYPDQAGFMPVQFNDLSHLQQNILDLQSQLINANRTWPNVPSTYRYQPQHTNNAQEAIETPPAPFTVPSFAELYNGGKLPATGFLLGFRADGTTVEKNWQDLYSCIVNGASGQGKSTLLRLILAQAANQGARFVICDPHYGAGEESLGASLEALYSRMAGEIATNDREIEDMVRYVDNIGRGRIDGHDSDRTPLILVMDETTSLLQRSSIADTLEATLGAVTQEYRKAGVYGVCLGQNFNSDIMPTRIRNCFASVLSMPAPRDTLGRMITRRAAQDLESLQFTQALWSKIGAEHEIFTFPNCTQHDIELVANGHGSRPSSRPSSNLVPDLVPDLVPPAPVSAALGASWNHLGTTWELGSEPPVTPPPARSLRVAQMLRDGQGVDAIISDVWGVDGRGRAYQNAKTELYQILASGLDNGGTV